MGFSAFGSTTTSAPIFSADVRLKGEGSEAITGPIPCALNAAITASPMAPQPTTKGTSPS